MSVALSIQRSSQKHAWTEEELDRLSRIGRHVENALRLGIRLINAEASQLALSDVLARVGVGVFMLAGDGRVLFANPAGEALLGDELVVSGGRLTARVQGPREALHARIRSASFGEAGALDNPRPILVPGSPQGILAVHILPVRPAGGGAVETLLASTTAIAVVTSSEAGGPADPALVRDLFGLTLAEARLAALVGNGLAPREAGERLGITEATARTTLKRVFQKTGATRQSELAALLARMMVR